MEPTIKLSSMRPSESVDFKVHQQKISNQESIEASKSVFLKKMNGLIEPQKKIKNEVKLAKAEEGTTKKITKIKAREAEDAKIKPRFPLIRQASTPNFTTQKLVATHLESMKKEKIAAKTGEMWECIDCSNDKYGGEVYTFKIKPEFQTMNAQKHFEVYEKMWPAVEIEPHQIDLLLSPDVKLEDLSGPALHLLGSIIKVRRELKQLGYDFKSDRTGNDCYLKLPDRNALMARWERLRIKYPDLNELDVADSSGVASDIAFIEAYLSHDCMLSSGKEFIHDHTVHLLPTLAFMLSREVGKLIYPKEKFYLVKNVVQNYRKLVIARNQLIQGTLNMNAKAVAKAKKGLDQIDTVLGVIVDEISASPNPRKLGGRAVTKDIMGRMLSTVTVDSPKNPWIKYWNHRFGPPNVLTPEMMQKMWKLVNEIVTQFDDARFIAQGGLPFYMNYN